MRRPSVAFMAMRASHITCLPAASAAVVSSACMYGHVPMHTASTSLASHHLAPVAVGARDAELLGHALARFLRLRLATDTSSMPGWALSLGM